MSFEPSQDIDRLIAIMAALRDPATGCSWDIGQTFESIVPYTIEEAYEVAEAIGRGDTDDLRDELGDLLLQVVFHARMAEEQGSFAFGDVVEAITRKLIRRHPHVFGAARNLTPDEVKQIWRQIKQAEKAERRLRRGTEPEAHLDAVAANLPALIRAAKLQARAAEVGFDWNDAALVLDKIREETAEVADALRDEDKSAIQDEIGDLLFAAINLARHVGIDPEAALRSTNAKFVRRFNHIEAQLTHQGSSLQDSSLDEMERLWMDAKHREREVG